MCEHAIVAILQRGMNGLCTMTGCGTPFIARKGSPISRPILTQISTFSIGVSSGVVYRVAKSSSINVALLPVLEAFVVTSSIPWMLLLVMRVI